VDIEAMALYFASQLPAQRQPPAFGDASAGEPLSANCGSCHGAQGISRETTIPSLAAQDALYLKNSIKAYRDSVRIQEGMHKFLADLSDKDIEDIAAYYSVQTSRPAEESTVSMKKLAEKCDRCHGPAIDNPMMITPKIDGQNKAYLIKALHAYRDNTRSSSPMHKMSLPYSEAMIEGIASWYASQPAR
jgi:cytochrome c553